MALPDPFTGANGTTLQAYDPTWVRHPSYSINCVLASNAVKVNSGGSSLYRYDVSPGSADYDVICDATYSTASSNTGGVVGRVSSSADTFYYARISNSSVELYKFINSTPTLLGSASHGMSSGVASQLKLSMVGTALSVYVGGALKISTTDSSITSAGYAGIRINANSTNISLDNFDIVTAGTTIAAGVGNAVAAGLTATISQSATISAGIGNAVAAGLNAEISQELRISAGIANADAAGAVAQILQTATVSSGIGNAVAAGLPAAIEQTATISCGIGAAVAVGLTADISQSGSSGSDVTIDCAVGNAVAAGKAAAIEFIATILCSIGAAQANGLTAQILVSGDDELYPLAGESESFALAGQAQEFPLAGQTQTFALE